jgi:hypothetical protein
MDEVQLANQIGWILVGACYVGLAICLAVAQIMRKRKQAAA